MKQFHRIGSQSGAGLLETLVAIGILGIAVVVWVNTVSQANRFNVSQRTLSEESELSQYVVNTISCPLTLDPPGALPKQCTALGQPVKLYDRTGSVFVDTPFSRVKDKYQLRARCDNLGGPGTPQPRGIVVESLRLKKGTTQAANKVYETSQTETWKPLFEPGLSPCSTYSLPEYLSVTNDLNIDPIALASILIWATNGTSPVNACADSHPTYWELETSIIYEGAAACPRGYSAVSGGVDCSMGKGVVTTTDIAPYTSPNGIRRKAFKTNSALTKKSNIPLWLTLDNQIRAAGDDTDLWFGGCCVAVNTVPPVPLFPIGSDIKDRVWVRCKRDLTI